MERQEEGERERERCGYRQAERKTDREEEKKQEEEEEKKLQPVLVRSKLQVQETCRHGVYNSRGGCLDTIFFCT